MAIKFTINIKPEPQARPRFSSRGSFVQTYDPPKSKKYKKKVIEIAKQYAPSSPISNPIRMGIVFYVPIPKSKSKVWRQRAIAGKEYPAVRPDIDNYAKAILDALNGIIFSDDGKIVELQIFKRYSDFPRTEIIIKELVTEVQAKLF